MKNKLFSSKLIRRVLSIVLVAGLLAAAYSRNFVSEAIFDPDKAINYQQFAASTNVENSVLFIGTYIVHKDALNDQIYDKAKNSASESGQSDIYYKSEISDGQWFNIGDIENGVKGISTQGKPENIETINPLYVTYYVGADGIMKDAKTLASVNPFDVPDPYDLSTLEELSPIRNQYTMSQSATSISQEDFLSGKGSKEQPYIIEKHDIKTLADVYIGNYVSFNDTKFRVVNRTEDSTKVASAEVLNDENETLKMAIGGSNNKYSKNNPLGHAEINAIIKATKKLKTTNLKECELYVTLKPCKMCQSIIREMRIKKVYYYIENKKYINDNVKYIKIDTTNNNIFKNKIVDFFKNKR